VANGTSTSESIKKPPDGTIRGVETTSPGSSGIPTECAECVTKLQLKALVAIIARSGLDILIICSLPLLWLRRVPERIDRGSMAEVFFPRENVGAGSKFPELGQRGKVLR
jgi:hypothetical protein